MPCSCLRAQSANDRSEFNASLSTEECDEARTRSERDRRAINLGEIGKRGWGEIVPRDPGGIGLPPNVEGSSVLTGIYNCLLTVLVILL